MERSLFQKAQQNYTHHIHSVIHPVRIEEDLIRHRVHHDFGFAEPGHWRSSWWNTEGIHRDAEAYGSGSPMTTSTYRDALFVIDSYLNNHPVIAMGTDGPHIVESESSSDDLDAAAQRMAVLETRGVDGCGSVVTEDSFSEDSIGRPTPNTPCRRGRRAHGMSRDMDHREECLRAASLAKYDDEVLGQSNETPTKWLRNDELEDDDGDGMGRMQIDGDEEEHNGMTSSLPRSECGADDDGEYNESSFAVNSPLSLCIERPRESDRRRLRGRNTETADDDVLDDEMREYVITNK